MCVCVHRELKDRYRLKKKIERSDVKERQRESEMEEIERNKN